MSKPEISIICCNYNHAQYIQEAIESIVYQTFSDWELIIIDDGSTDDSKEIISNLKKLDERIKEPIFLQENKGKWFALNTAIAKANGKLITNIDADDLAHKDRLDRQWRVLNEFKLFGIITGFKHCYNQKDIDEGMLFDTKQLVGYSYIDNKETLKYALHSLKNENINHFHIDNYEIHCNSILWYKQFWERGLKYNPNNLGLMLSPGEDTDLSLRLTLLTAQVGILKEPLYLYRRNTSTNPAFRLKK